METTRYIIANELKTFIQPIPQSASTDMVNAQIKRPSDGFTWNFTTLLFEDADNWAAMIYESAVNWKQSFTPPTSDNYDVIVYDVTLNSRHWIHFQSREEIDTAVLKVFSASIPQSLNTDNVAIQIFRSKDNFTFNFTTLAFEDADNQGPMTYIGNYIWEQSFTAPTDGEYFAVIVDFTLGSTRYVFFNATGSADTFSVTDPTLVTAFKSYFDRAFTYGPDLDKVRDKDIQQALDMARTMFNPGLWCSVTETSLALNLLTAHYLVKAINSGGLQSTGEFAVNSKSAGPLSASFKIPEDLANNPVLAPFLTTSYGIQYAQMAAARAVGNIMVGEGNTTP